MILDPRNPVAPDELGRLATELSNLWDAIQALRAPTGTQAFQTVAQLTALVNNINATLNNYINNYSYTRTQIDARVLDPAQSGGNVSTNASARFNGGLASTDVYGHLINYGSYRATWTNQDGTIGYAPSSRQFKQDVTDWKLDPSLLMSLRPVLFRYIADVQENGTDAVMHAGLIAEEVDALGLRELVDYDDEGKPFGVNYALVAIALINLMQTRAAQRSRQVVAKALPAIAALRGATVAVTWPSAMPDSDYSVTCGIAASDGSPLSAIASLVPETRTPAGCTVAVLAIGADLAAGQTLTVEGLHP